jgi:hypothetical protein
MMLGALLTSIANDRCGRICTNERTDALTQKLVTSQGEIALRNAREQQPKRPCICLAKLYSCPDNCFLRWY